MHFCLFGVQLSRKILILIFCVFPTGLTIFCKRTVKILEDQREQSVGYKTIVWLHTADSRTKVGLLFDHTQLTAEPKLGYWLITHD